MKVSDKKFCKLLNDKGLTNSDLRRAIGVSGATIAKLTHGDDVKISVLIRVCEVLGCNVGDIMDIVPDEEALQSELDRHYASGEITDEMLAALGKQHLRTPYGQTGRIRPVYVRTHTQSQLQLHERAG